MTDTDHTHRGETSEGAQEMRPRGQTDAAELAMEKGAFLRLPEGHTVSTDDVSIEVDEGETMIINMGPQHPSTHGVLRVMMELEGETVLAFFEKVTGLRMNYNFIRPGGVAADLPAGWRDDVLEICDLIEPRLDEYDDVVTGQPIFQQRTQGVGVISAEQAIALGASGPILRATGTPWDLRADMPYQFYEQLDF